MEHGEPRADLLREREQVELDAELPVVAALGLLQPQQVRVEVLLGRPRGAVDPGELRVLLVAAPVRAGDRGQLERAEPAGRGHVRPEAQVLPAVVAVEADGVAGGHLARLVLHRLDDLALELLAVQTLQGFCPRYVLTDERLVGGDDRPHLVLDPRQVLGRHVRGDVEVVVEAVGDRGADRVAGAGPQASHGLGQDVGGRVPKDVQPVVGPHVDRLDRDVPRRHEGQVAQLAVDARRDGRGRERGADRLPLGELHGGAVGQGQASAWREG